ncbi:uncharacterized protein LOC112559966 [Pomacea canaliculata]|uniref:uncharacterized protein LOC112559966 n=1 Tax=Pomacea canaliculata TaxID=400727 RepID=UPI000D73D003|nr:uncharacterized protein LOC112559966 [Pomacea canaliculata]
MKFQLPALAVLVLTLWCIVNAGSMQGKTYLLADTGYRVTTHQVHVHARSKIDCIRTCRQFSNCTSFVFEKSSGDCYLNPNITSGGDGSVHLYADAVPACSPESMPSFNNGTVDVWRQTLTTLEGNVACNGDFMKPLSPRSKFNARPMKHGKQTESAYNISFEIRPCKVSKFLDLSKKGGQFALKAHQQQESGLLSTLWSTPTTGVSILITASRTSGKQISPFSTNVWQIPLEHVKLWATCLSW